MERDSYWDSLKFILVSLVVYAHTTECHFPVGSFNRVMYNFLSMFLMPLFIFTSGRFSHIHDKAKYKQGIIRLIETYIVFQFIRTCFYVLLGVKPSITCLTIPNWILWYLVALIYWRLMIYFIPKRWLQNRKIVLASTFFISLIAGFIPIGPQFVVQRTLTFLPFFAMGYYSIYYDIRKYINKIPIILSFAVLICSWCLFYFLFNKDLSFMLLGTFPYWADDISQTMMNFGTRCIFFPSSIILGAMVMRIIPNNKVLAKWGTVTLFIYIYHSFAVNILHLLTYKNILPHNKLILFVYAVTITLGLVFLSHSKFLNILLNPISYYIKREKEKLTHCRN